MTGYISTVEHEPFTEQFSTSEPESEPTIEPESEPETEQTIIPESEAEGWPEPGPEWNKAFQEWGIAWPFHIYLYTSVYLILGLLALLYIIILCSSLRGHLRSKLTISLLVMIFLFNITRGLSLLLDPYSSNRNVNALGSRFLWSFGLPGLTSSFSLVMLVLLDTTRMTIGPPRFQKLSTIIGISVLHLIIVFLSDLVVYINNDAKSMLVICQSLFITYGLLLGVGYLYVGVRIHQNCEAGSYTSENQSGAIRRLTLLSFISAGTACAICATHIYSAASVFGVYSDVKYIDSWSWWCLQTLSRFEEIISSILVLSIATASVHTKVKMKITSLFKCCRNRSKGRIIPVINTPQTSQICTIELNSRSDDSSW